MWRINNHLCRPPPHQRQHYTLIYLHWQPQLHQPYPQPPRQITYASHYPTTFTTHTTTHTRKYPCSHGNTWQQSCQQIDQIRCLPTHPYPLSPNTCHIYHPFWHSKILMKYPHTTRIQHLKPCIHKEYTRQLTTSILPRYPYVAKWLNSLLLHFQLLQVSTPMHKCPNHKNI